MSVYQRLESLSIKLPVVAPPVAAFVPFVRSGRLVFVSGHIAKRDGAPWVGQLGAGVDVEQGKLAARAVAVDLMATLHAATGNLDAVARIVKLLVLVKRTPACKQQQLVASRASGPLDAALRPR